MQKGQLFKNDNYMLHFMFAVKSLLNLNPVENIFHDIASAISCIQ